MAMMATAMASSTLKQMGTRRPTDNKMAIQIASAGATEDRLEAIHRRSAAAAMAPPPRWWTLPQPPRKIGSTQARLRI
eukprot:7490340-Pyramimonas_sp.AAC.1